MGNKQGHLYSGSISVTSSYGDEEITVNDSFSFLPGVGFHTKVEHNNQDKIIFLTEDLDLVLGVCNLDQEKIVNLQISDEELIHYCTRQGLQNCKEIIVKEDI